MLNRGESASSNNYPNISESSVKCRKRYVYYPKGKSKTTCLIHGPGHLSYECKVLGDFGSKYAKSRSTKYRGHNIIPRKKFNSQQENNFIVNSEVYEILLHENQKVGAEK